MRPVFRKQKFRMCNPPIPPPKKKVSCVGFKLDPVYFVISYTSLGGAEGYFLLKEKWPCLSRWQGAAEYSDWGIFHILLKYGHLICMKQKSLMDMVDL